MPTGQDLIDRAKEHLGEDYVYGADSRTWDPQWHGPWDCAEFVTWVVYQVTKRLCGCIKNDDPTHCDAYTGAWARDAEDDWVKRVPVTQAANTVGGILLRLKRPALGGHIVFSDGEGGTVEAHSAYDGVCCLEVKGRKWDVGILIPGVEYKEV